MHNDVIILKDKYFEKRGNIYTIFNTEDMPRGLTFVQDKISKSFQGVIRGFHGDNKTWKLVTSVYGDIFQVVVDCRKESRTYSLWDSFNLSNIFIYFKCMFLIQGSRYNLSGKQLLFPKGPEVHEWENCS